LLGAAILKYEIGEYEFVFAIARAILTEICSAEINGNSADECPGQRAAGDGRRYSFPAK
jgi:hypothetical protein